MKTATLIAVLALSASACSGTTASTSPPPSAADPTPTAPLPVTTESPSGVLSTEFQAWQALGIEDYDLEYVLTRDSGGGDSGRYRAVVRGGEPLSCYFDGVHSRRIPCDSSYYTVEGIFGRVVNGDARLADVEYDASTHVPFSIDHDLVGAGDGPYTIEVESFATAEPIDWVAYVEEVVAFWEAGYVGTASVDWGAVRESALRLVSAVPRQTNAHVALRQAANLIPAARFASAVQAELNLEDAMATVRRLAGDPPSGERLAGGVGYVNIPGTDPDQWGTFASDIDSILAVVDSPPVCGWIVDLRSYRFADPTREIVGLGPLIGDGEITTIVTADGATQWAYRSGEAFIGGVRAEERYEAEGLDSSGLSLSAPYEPVIPEAPVAVLLGVETAYSLLVVALDVRNHVRTFGAIPSVGSSTLNLIGTRSVKRMADGAEASIQSVAEAADAVTGIRPDEVVLDVPDATDETMAAALAWLAGDFGCGAGD